MAAGDFVAVVVITGANSGIGLAAVEAFARQGDVVYATVRDVAKVATLRDIAETDQLDVRIRRLDVTEPASFDDAVGEIANEAGAIDVLVNNAGILRAGALEDISESAFRQVIETNFVGPMLLTRAVLPCMRAQRRGYIIMMSSLSGIAGLPGDVTYAASKFALEGATEALRHEVDRWNIKVALVQAALYSTGIFGESGAQGALPADYPQDSPYRPLVEQQAREIRARLPAALDPAEVGRLFVRIAASDGSQLRWPADSVAASVMQQLLGQDDATRDRWLRDIANTAWWTEGRHRPD